MIILYMHIYLLQYLEDISNRYQTKLFLIPRTEEHINKGYPKAKSFVIYNGFKNYQNIKSEK